MFGFEFVKCEKGDSEDDDSGAEKIDEEADDEADSEEYDGELEHLFRCENSFGYGSVGVVDDVDFPVVGVVEGHAACGYKEGDDDGEKEG